MYAFEMHQPVTLDAALDHLASGARPLAGGQTLLASMKLRLSNPETLVDLGRVAGLDAIEVAPDAVCIGAMARHADVAAHTGMRAVFPALADLAGRIGDRQVRAMGTLGGVIANNDPAACYPSALLASGATVITTGREIAADDFFLGLFATALQDGELVRAVRFPVPRMAAYEKQRQPASQFPLAGVFVARFADGIVRVAITGAGGGVLRHTALEAVLSEDFRPEAAAAVRFDPQDAVGDLHAPADYRAHLIDVLSRRAVASALRAG